jgi:hypothetical protein
LTNFGRRLSRDPWKFQNSYANSRCFGIQASWETRKQRRLRHRNPAVLSGPEALCMVRIAIDLLFHWEYLFGGLAEQLGSVLLRLL